VWAVAAGLVLAALSVTLVRKPALRPADQRATRGEGPAPVPLPVGELTSYRSATGSRATVSATILAYPFLLRLDLHGLKTANPYMVQIVSDSGSRVWSATGTASAASDWLEVTVEGGRLAAGAFWVRLSGTRSDGSAELLREYSL